MAIVAEGPFAKAEEHLANSFGASPRFRAWAKASTADQAQSRIYFGDLPTCPVGQDAYTREQMEAFRPFVIIATNPRQGARLKRGAYLVAQDSGSLVVLLEQDVPKEKYREQEQVKRCFLNDLGIICKELFEVGEQAGTLSVSEISLSGPIESEVEQEAGEGRFLYAWLTVTWGVM